MTLSKKEKCFEVKGGQFTTIRNSKGDILTGDAKQKVLQQFNANPSSFIQNKTEAIEAAEVNFARIPVHYTKRFTGDYGDVSILGGYSVMSGTVKEYNRTSGISLGNAHFLQSQTTGPRSVVTEDLIVDKARQTQVVNQSTRGLSGKALDLGLAYKVDVTDNFSIEASITSKYILDSSDSFIKEDSFMGTSAKLAMNLHNFTKSLSFGVETQFNFADQLRDSSEEYRANLLWTF